MANTKEEILAEIQVWQAKIAAVREELDRRVKPGIDYTLTPLVVVENEMAKMLADNPMEVSWLDRCEKKAKALTREKCRKFLDLMESDITVGAACETCGIDYDTAIGIASLNHSLIKSRKE